MAQSPNIDLVHETVRHMHDSIDAIGDIWRHEGLKKGVETALATAGYSEAARWVLEQVSGGSAPDDRLRTTLDGVEMEGPVGIAPGWDKTGKTVVGWQQLGAHHITPGGITLFPQKGNPMPRLRTFDKRIGDHGTRVSLNAYGFPSRGADSVTYEIGKQLDEVGDVKILIIPQLTLNKEMYEEANQDAIPNILATTARKLLPIARGFNFGLSSPNTARMRAAQTEEFLYRCVSTVMEAGGNDLSYRYKGDADGGVERWDMYCRLVERTGVGLELINTTALPHIKSKYGAEDTPGGLAGADPEYQDMAVQAVRYMYEAVGDKVDIIGMGGVDSGERALTLIRNGASAIGINTAIRRLGAKAVTTIEQKISDLLDHEAPGTAVRDLIGIDTQRGAKQAA